MLKLLFIFLLIFPLFGCQRKETTLDNQTSYLPQVGEKISEVEVLQTYLEQYRIEHGYYPERLEEIKVNFSLEDYTYTPIGALPTQYYDLCYNLETNRHCTSPGTKW